MESLHDTDHEMEMGIKLNGLHDGRWTVCSITVALCANSMSTCCPSAAQGASSHADCKLTCSVSWRPHQHVGMQALEGSGQNDHGSP